ncbi:hypothetical protein D3C72_1495550 [compost metagenome]
MANFWKASLQGSEMISTLVPGLALSNFETMPFSVSVRSGLVMTSTSFKVVSASAVPVIRAVKIAAATSFFMSFSPFLSSV